VDRLNLEDVWQLHTPALRWGMVQFQFPADTNGSTVLDCQVPDSAEPILTRVTEDAARFGDAVGTGWASVLLISPTVQAVFAPFNGWRGVPITVTDDRLNGYVVLAVIGRLGQVSEDPGGLGLFVDPDTWDGSPIFKPENLRGIWMIGGVASALRKAKCKGVSIERYVGWEPAAA
jgi:hypothetical protein